MKNGKRALALAITTIIALMTFAPSVHAQGITGQYDRTNYVSGDTGTMTVVIVNNNANNGLEVRNLTVYWPWATLRDGKWDGANVSINISPWAELGNRTSGKNIYTNSVGFTIPSWYQAPLFSNGAGGCDTSQRYTMSSGCILVGLGPNSNFRYEQTSLGIQMAIATYTPMSLAANWLPIATLIVLVVATAFLGMAWMSLRKTAKKA